MSERRRAPRYAARGLSVEVSEQAFLRIFGRRRAKAETVIDISGNGARLLLGAAPPASGKLDLTLHVLGEERPIRLRGEIAWARAASADRLFQIGVRFVDPDTGFQRRLGDLAQSGRLIELVDATATRPAGTAAAGRAGEIDTRHRRAGSPAGPA
ncbi:MAG: PilZ domain-containing protein [Planctomycetes bacterium]|nr:PilZ domain-containing protein [Planctomycetota bacterium]